MRKTEFNLIGLKVVALVDGWIGEGRHSVNRDGLQYSKGIYFYRLSAGDREFTRRMTPLK